MTAFRVLDYLSSILRSIKFIIDIANLIHFKALMGTPLWVSNKQTNMLFIGFFQFIGSIVTGVESICDCTLISDFIVTGCLVRYVINRIFERGEISEWPLKSRLDMQLSTFISAK